VFKTKIVAYCRSHFSEIFDIGLYSSVSKWWDECGGAFIRRVQFLLPVIVWKLLDLSRHFHLSHSNLFG
jgi:hypothetical protein